MIVCTLKSKLVSYIAYIHRIFVFFFHLLRNFSFRIYTFQKGLFCWKLDGFIENRDECCTPYRMLEKASGDLLTEIHVIHQVLMFWWDNNDVMTSGTTWIFFEISKILKMIFSKNKGFTLCFFAFFFRNRLVSNLCLMCAWWMHILPTIFRHILVSY